MAVSVLFSLSVATPSDVVYFEYTTTRVSSDHTSHAFYYFCFCIFEIGTFFVVCDGGLLVFLFLCGTLSLAVFSRASAFNQDVSKWKTGAVTYMNYSKCILSLPLCGHASRRRCCVFEHTCTTTRVSSDYNFHTFCYVLCFGMVLLWFVVGWSFSSLLHPLFCSVL